MLFRDISYADENFETKTGSVLVEDGRIAWTGTGVPEDYHGEIYDGRDKMLLPGFYNTHCHVPMVLARGYGEGLPLDRWLNERIFPFEDKLGAEDAYWASLLGMAEMIKSGVVSFTEMYFHVAAIARAVDECGMKANISNAAVSFSDSVKYMDTRAGQETAWLVENSGGFKHGRIICDASLHAEYTCTEGMAREVAQYAKEHGLRMHVHVSETRSEHEGAKSRRGGRTPARFLADCGLFDVPATAAHCVWAEDSDLELFREKGVTVAHCPSSNLKLGSGIAPVVKMRGMGVNVGIGTDGAGSNNNLNGLEEVNLATLLAKGVTQDPLCMSMAETLRIACENGAKSQGRFDCGSIKTGNRADLIVFDLNSPNLLPVFDPLANVLYAGSAENICMTMVDGKVLYKDGELLTIDIEKVMAEACLAQKRILGSF